MARRSERVDYYALLHVSPQASLQEITEAYQQQRERYDPEYTASAAPELQELAAQKREQLEDAYATLADTARRAAYDRQQRFAPASSETFDYRPLPPARGQERAIISEPIDQVADAPVASGRTRQERGAARWIGPLVAAILALTLITYVVISPIRVSSDASALATPTIANLTLPFTSRQIQQFRTAAEGGNTAPLWTALGNALFDNLQILRETARVSPQYQQQIDVWLDVIAAYDRSLALADNPVVRSSRAVALINYGIDAQDPDRVAEAVAEVERGIAADVTDPRALLNYGMVLTLTDPPRMEEAVAQWRRLVETAPDSQEAQVARTLLQRYDQSS